MENTKLVDELLEVFGGDLPFRLNIAEVGNYENWNVHWNRNNVLFEVFD